MTKTPTTREPVLTAALASLIIWAALRFGLPIGNDLADTIAGLATAALTVWARSRVTPVAKRRPTFGPNQRGESALVVIVAVLVIVFLLILIAPHLH